MRTIGDLVVGAALAGKAARVIGDPDQPHSYTYTVDAARTLAALGARDDLDGEVFHVPNAPAQTTRQIIDMISEQLGAPIKANATPRVLLRALGLFNPTIRELDEMRYEFTQPFIVDSTKTQTRLDITPTPLPSSFTTRTAARPAVHARGLPPKVDVCISGSRRTRPPRPPPCPWWHRSA